VVEIQVEVYALASINLNQMRGKGVKRFFDFQYKMLRIMISRSCTFLLHIQPYEIMTYIQIGFSNPNVGVDLIDLGSSRGGQPKMWSNPPLFSKWQRITPIPDDSIIP
jgi:hypothetical protein